jgi:hypothetical protein
MHFTPLFGGPLALTPEQQYNVTEDELNKCRLELLNYLRFVGSDAYPFLRPQRVTNDLATYTDEQLAGDIIYGWDSNYPKLLLHGARWQNVRATMFPYKAGWAIGNYLNFLRVMADLLQPERTMVYGSLSTDSHGESPAYRAEHSSYHYIVYDLPGTISTFGIIAVYPEGRHGLVSLNESFTISGLVLWENKYFVNALIRVGIDLPVISNFAQRGNTGMIGLNRTAGMDGMDHAHTPEPRLLGSEKQFDEKARRFITTGEFQSIKVHNKANGGLKVRLFNHHLDKGKAWWMERPGLHGHDDAIVFLSLTPRSTHPNAFFQRHKDNMAFLQFGVWIQVVGGHGLWIQSTTRFEAMNATANLRGKHRTGSRLQKSREGALKRYEAISETDTKICETVIQVYNLKSSIESDMA